MRTVTKPGMNLRLAVECWERKSWKSRTPPASECYLRVRPIMGKGGDEAWDLGRPVH